MPPSTIRVGPYRYRVVMDERRLREFEHAERSRNYGYADRKELLIVLDPRMPHERTAEVLWHEVKHVVADVVGLDGKLDEETYTNRSAPMELAVLRDNPQLVVFLTAIVDRMSEA